MQANALILIFLSLTTLLTSCSSTTGKTVQLNVEINESLATYKKQRLPYQKTFDPEQYTYRTAFEWGENITGVKTSFVTDKREVALTFDACGGESGDDFDQELIKFLRQEEIPATLFLNKRWIQSNEEIFLDLATDPLFQIENHGTLHKPLSINGGEAWGISATESVEEVYDEIMNNGEYVQKLTGETMTLFRSGTAYYDEVAVEIAEALGYEVVNFNILGDAGATYSSTEVERALLNAKPGSIALLHMNHPKSGTAEGVKRAIPQLIDDGYTFVLLKDQQLQ